jgi:AcrR family transcriptional regulator
MPRPRQVSDQQILASARAAFLRDGPGVSTTVIADDLGVSQAALFKRFGTKEQLLRRSMAPESPDWAAVLGDGPDERPIPAQLQVLGRTVSEFYERLVPCMATLRSAGVSPHELFADEEVPPPVRGVRAVAAWLAVAGEQGRVRDLDVDSFAMAFLGALQSRAFLRHVSGRPGPGADAGKYVDQLVDLLWRGIAPENER